MPCALGCISIFQNRQSRPFFMELIQRLAVLLSFLIGLEIVFFFSGARYSYTHGFIDFSNGSNLVFFFAHSCHVLSVLLTSFRKVIPVYLFRAHFPCDHNFVDIFRPSESLLCPRTQLLYNLCFSDVF